VFGIYPGLQYDKQDYNIPEHNFTFHCAKLNLANHYHAIRLRYLHILCAYVGGLYESASSGAPYANAIIRD
jgi:hypothetical protein